MTVLGVHVSAWASGKDVSYGSVTDPLDPEVAKVHDFLAPLGLEANTTGGAIALLFGAGTGGQSGYQNDTFSDGKLFLESRAGDFFKAGGLAIAP